MDSLSIQTKKRKEIVDITNNIQAIVKKKDLNNGVVQLFLTHTTAALTTADLDPGTDLDMLDAFEEMIPKLNYRHPHDPSHVPSHILSSLIGTSLTLLVKDGELVLGTWQRVVLVELDGPKDRIVIVSFQE
ncbi:YjbQ family protein [Candidatus Roizmanbacteria bacterium]|nr:YjbQ family protein [Candidatus Roizmanbacteria bacterium]